MKRESKTVGILAIGNEVLDGVVLDTNSNWMELRLVAQGAHIKRLVSVRDELDEIREALNFLRDSCDIIITTGGLGPTHDDMTLKAIGKAIGRKVVENSDALSIVKRQYQSLYERGIVSSPDITEARRKMAHIPEGATPLDNRVGGAPGVMIQLEEVVIFCLPGVPSELKFIFEDSIVPWIIENVTQRFYEKVVEFGIHDESVFSPAIDIAMKKHPGVYVKSMPKTYGTSKTLRVWVSARGNDNQDLKELVKNTIRELEKVTGLTSTPVEE
ncbi:MAG: competence/damage-inducible protein A [Candidatus Thorarchaeota archaeon]|nr:competence/damage-inducible protein A [Candidatus Thorarchaeota archaeon]